MQKIGTIVSLLLLQITPAFAGANMEFWVSNYHPHIVYMQLHAPERQNVWPNATQSYVLNRTSHVVRISCYKGEQICFGAATTNDQQNISYWGRGTGPNSMGCASCCYTCSHGARVNIGLRPAENPGEAYCDE